MQDSEKFIVDYLKEKFPALDVRPGTGLRDVLVRPLVGILDRLREDIAELRDNSDLMNYAVMDPVVLDKRASNWFLTRERGQKAAGYVRIYMDKQIDIEISEGHRFVYGGDELVFTAVDTFYFAASSLTKVPSANEWYCNVNVASIEEGAKYNIDPGEFADYDPININVVRVQCVESFTSGKDIEDNTAFYERLRNAVTVRNLINPLSIDTVLREKKDFLIKDLYVAGFGSPEMWRDYITGDLGSFHIGNKTDIYVKMPILNRTKTYVVDSNARIVFDIEDVPIYRLTSFNGSALNMPSISAETDFLLRFSKDEEPYIQSALAPGVQVEVSFDTIDIDTIDNYIRNSDNRVTTASLLVRGLAPIYVSFDIRYKLKPGVAPIDESIILEAARNYINEIPIGGAPEASDIDAGVRGMYGEIDRVVLPLTLNGKLTDFEGSAVNISSQDALVITENLQKSLSKNTVVYIADQITIGAV
jgi:uncharacterized phage protein gp47/JayE